MPDYYGQYYHEKNRAEDTERKYQQLATLYGNAQNIILEQSKKILELNEGKCGGHHTIVTYILPPIPELITDEI